jgi:hypothetical protein
LQETESPTVSDFPASRRAFVVRRLFRLVSSVFFFTATVAARNVGRVDRRNLNRRFYLLVKNNPRNAEFLRVRNVKKRSREENVDALKRRVSFNDATLIFRSF